MNRFCEVCGMGDMVLGETSTLYCRNCGAQSNQYIEEAFDADDAHIFNTTFVRERGTTRNAEQHHQQPELPRGNALDEAPDDLQGLHDAILSTPAVKTEDLSQPGSQFGLGSQFGQGYNLTGRMSNDELADTIRKSYVSGVQRILQLQCESLVNDFGVTPLICGIAGPVWLRFVASTRVFEKAWAEEAVMVAEHRARIRRENQPLVSEAAGPSNEDGAKGKRKRKRKSQRLHPQDASGPRTSYGRQLRYVWLSALKERIPLSMTLAVSYLSCYIARDPVLPTDIKNWALDGQLPYLAAFMEISKSAPHHIPNTVGEKQIFPLKPRLMFRPLNMVGARLLERQAAFVAERIGIQLPPVNFHAICARLLRKMGLSVEKLLPYACRFYDWYTPTGLFLSPGDNVLPTRVYVMAMLVITLKVLYNLDGRPHQKGRLPRSTVKGRTARLKTPDAPKKTIDRQINPDAMMTRAKRKALAEVGADEEQQTSPAQSIHEKEVTTAGEDHVSAPKGEILGKRKRSRIRSEQESGSQGSGEGMPTFRATSGLNSQNRSAKFRGVQTELGDAMELLERLESAQTTKPTNFDEELSKYLKYCQNVIFASDDRDAGMEPILDIFRGIYEKNMTKVGSQPVLNSDDEAAADGGSDKVPTPRAETPRSPARAGSLGRGVPSAGSSTDWVGKMEASKKKLEEKSEEKVLHTDNNTGSWAQENESAPAPEFDRRETKRRETSSLLIDMAKAGFSCLPPLAYHVGSDEYVRYKFQDSSQGLVPVHENYFRVLQACGKLIEVHPKTLNRCVQRIEKGLLQVETNVEKFLLGEKDVNVIELAKAVKRRKPQRRRDKIAEADNAAKKSQHIKDLGYL